MMSVKVKTVPPQPKESISIGFQCCYVRTLPNASQNRLKPYQNKSFIIWWWQQWWCGSCCGRVVMAAQNEGGMGWPLPPYPQVVFPSPIKAPMQKIKSHPIDPDPFVPPDQNFSLRYNSNILILSKPQPNLNTRLGLTTKWLCTPHPLTETQCQQYLSCYWPDFDETSNVDSWEHLE